MLFDETKYKQNYENDFFFNRFVKINNKVWKL
jgi:hypothetical protein